MKLKNTIFVVLLLTGLTTPFVLRTVKKKWEMYPAILMPAGESLLRESNGSLTFTKKHLYGISTFSGKEVLLNITSILDPIPEHFFGDLLKRDLGMQSRNSQAIKDWWGKKLNDLGCRDSLLIYKKIEVSLPTMEETIIKEIRYELGK